jgi:hypothetical protein
MSRVVMEGPPKLWTTGRIAEEEAETRERVDYVIRTRNITPTALAGQTRLFDREAVAVVRYHLRLLNEKRRSSDG